MFVSNQCRQVDVCFKCYGYIVRGFPGLFFDFQEKLLYMGFNIRYRGIKINRTVLVGSVAAALLLLCASFSSVVGYQNTRSGILSAIQSNTKSLSKRFDALQGELMTGRQISQMIQNGQFQQTLHDVVEKKGDTRAASILARCSAVHEMLDNNKTIGRVLFVLVLTIIIEFFVYLAMTQSSVVALFFLSVIINGITNPAVNFVYYTIYNNVFVLESVVFIVEIFMIYILFNAFSVPVNISQAVLLSFLANLASYIFASGIARIVYDG